MQQKKSAFYRLQLPQKNAQKKGRSLLQPRPCESVLKYSKLIDYTNSPKPKPIEEKNIYYIIHYKPPPCFARTFFQISQIFLKFFPPLQLTASAAIPEGPLPWVATRGPNTLAILICNNLARFRCFPLKNPLLFADFRKFFQFFSHFLAFSTSSTPIFSPKTAA